MLDIKKLVKNELFLETEKTFKDYYKQSLEWRNASSDSLAQALEINDKRKALVTEAEQQKAHQNKVSQDIAKIKREQGDASSLMEEMKALSSQVKELEKQAQMSTEELNALLMTIPNYLHPSVPQGKDEEDNQILKTWGEKKEFGFETKDHAEIGEALGSLDFERAGKVTGARFTFMRKGAARLERALIQFMMDTHSEEHGYQEIIPPYMANSASMLGTGQFPKFKEDVFQLAGTDYYLIPTAEIPVTNLYAGEVLTEEQLPECLVAFSPCFRSEAGSYGRDTRGLIRQHQFHKVELLKFVHPDQSYNEHEKLTQDAEKILQLLELPYRVSLLCSGDTSFSAAKCYDLEVWLPGQKLYREISSCSNFEDFQARRANIRFRPKGKKAKPQFVHTLNGSGLAVGRTLVAIFENYQQEDGSVAVPKVLQPYMSGMKIIS